MKGKAMKTITLARMQSVEAAQIKRFTTRGQVVILDDDDEEQIFSMLTTDFINKFTPKPGDFVVLERGYPIDLIHEADVGLDVGQWSMKKKIKKPSKKQKKESS